MTAPSQGDFNRQYEAHLKHLRLKGLQPKTIEAYARAIRRIGAYFDHQIDDLSETQLTDYFTDLLESHSWSAVKLDLYGLKFYYTHVLHKSWVCPALIKPPKGQRLPDIVAVEVIDEDVLAPVTTGGDVIDGAGEFDTQWASDGGGTLCLKRATHKARLLEGAPAVERSPQLRSAPCGSGLGRDAFTRRAGRRQLRASPFPQEAA
jgi:hypothetical protein